MTDLPTRYLEIFRGLDRDPLYASLSEWKEVLTSLDSQLKHEEAVLQEKLGISSEASRKLCLQRVDYRWVVPFRFARLWKKTIGAEVKFVLPAPKRIRKAFEHYGCSIDHTFSSVLWSLSVLRGLTEAWKGHSREIARALLFHVRPLQVPEQEIKPTTVFYGLGPSELSSNPKKLSATEFLKSDFARRLPPFTLNQRIFIHRPWENQCRYEPAPELVFGRDISSQGLKKSELKLCAFLLRHLRLLYFELKAVARGKWPAQILLSELPEIPRYEAWFSAVKPRYFVVTNSIGSNFPAWATLGEKYGTQTWMLHYSAHHGCLTYTDEPNFTEVEPSNRYFLVDHHVVWDDEQKNYWISMGFDTTGIHTVGPIIFAGYPSRGSKPVPLSEPVQIAVFDLISWDPDFSLRNFGFATYPNKAENMIRFLEDIAKAARELFGEAGFEILLKSKRSAVLFAKDRRYLDFLESFKARSYVRSFDPEINLFEVIQRSHFVISAPFTSVSKVGAWMGVPSAYYDGSGKLRSLSSSTLPLIQSQGSLKTWLQSLLKEARKNLEKPNGPNT